MKKLFALVLALVMVLSLASCGGPQAGPVGDVGGDEGGEKLIDTIDTSNWQTVVKESYDIDVQLPEGWAVKRAQVNGTAGVKLGFTTGGTATLEDFSRTLFTLADDASEKITDMSKGTTTYTAFDEVGNASGVKIRYYISGDDYVKLSCYEISGIVEVVLTRDALK